MLALITDSDGTEYELNVKEVRVHYDHSAVYADTIGPWGVLKIDMDRYMYTHSTEFITTQKHFEKIIFIEEKSPKERLLF